MNDHDVACVDRALASRRSVRAFLPTPVPRATLEEIFSVAARSASGTNIQPWRVHVLTGANKEALSSKVIAAFDEADAGTKYRGEFPIYPSEWVSPFIDRRRKVGWDLYGLLGIGKGDRERTHRQHARNFRFFDAPVGLIFTVHRSLGYAAWVDYGMFLGNVMTAARARGLHTCPQFAWTQFHTIVAEHLALPADEKVLVGMALGHENESAIENTLRTERAPLSEWVSFDAV